MAFICFILHLCGMNFLVRLKSFILWRVSWCSISFGLFRRLFLKTEIASKWLWLYFRVIIFFLPVRRVWSIGLSLIFENLFHKKAAFLKLFPVIEISFVLGFIFWSDCIFLFVNVLMFNIVQVSTAILGFDNDNFGAFDGGIFRINT